MEKKVQEFMQEELRVALRRARVPVWKRMARARSHFNASRL